jgi:glutamine amidotransferase PdxT
MTDNELANQKSMRNYLLQKYVQEWIIILTCLGAIILAGKCKLIEPNTVGALLGVAVGYGLKGLRKLHK